MANTKVTTGVIKDDAVGADQLASNAVVTASITDNAVTTAKISDDAILTAKISNSAITNAKMSANSVDSDQYVDASIDTAHIRDGQITSAKLDTNISVSGELTVGSHLNMGDGDILKMGASGHLQIFHDGTHANIKESGSGDLQIFGDNVNIFKADGSQNLINATSGGAVTLYYAGNAKIATTSGGVTITGTANVGSVSSGSASSASEIIATSLDNGTSFGSNRMLKLVGTSTTDNSRMGIHFTGNTGVGNGLGIIEAVNEDQSAGHTSLRMHTYSGSWNENNLVLKSGSVGIGTASPDCKLHTLESTNNSGSTGLANGGLQIENTNTTSGSWSQLHLRSVSYDAHLRLLNDGTLKIMTENNTSAMTILDGGNVGIGTDSPNSWASYTDSAATILQVEDSSQRARIVINGGNGAHLDLVDYAGSANDKHMNISVDAGVLKFGSLNDAGNAFVQNNIMVMDLGTGKVGIGTDSPSTKLHLGGTAPLDSIIRQDSTTSGTNWEIGEREAGKWQIFEDDGDSIVATFMSSGKLLLGTTTSGTTDLLQIESPANAGGYGIQIRRNDNNTDQTVGRIMMGNVVDSDLGVISVKTDGANNNGAILFSTALSQTTAENMRISSDGNVTKPTQCNFLARRSGNQTGYNASGTYGDGVRYNSEIYDIGGDFDVTTGIFTAPVDGTYLIQGSVYTNTAGVSWSQAWLAVNDARANFTDMMGNDGDLFISTTHIVQLSAGDEVRYHPYYSGSTSVTILANNNHTWFKGYLLG